MREPRFKNGTEPVWFHGSGTRVRLDAKGDSSSPLILTSRSLAVFIRGPFPQSSGKLKDGNLDRWHVSWRLKHGIISGGAEDAGFRYFSSWELRTAFGLDDCIHESGVHLVRVYGGISAAQGLFIRWGDYLNIPGPGTGLNGDPNISIELNPEIKQAVGTLLDLDRHQKALF